MKENKSSDGRPVLPIEIVLANQELANCAPDSTKRNEHRPHTWNPPVITKDEYKTENPYIKL